MNKNSEVTTHYSYPLDFIGGLQLLFIAFKLLGIIKWSWFLVLLPITINIIVILVLLIILAIIGGLKNG
jgi:hypothetical protein